MLVLRQVCLSGGRLEFLCLLRAHDAVERPLGSPAPQSPRAASVPCGVFIVHGYVATGRRVFVP